MGRHFIYDFIHYWQTHWNSEKENMSFFCLVHPGRCNEAYGQWELLNTTETLNVKRSKDVSYKFTTPVSVPSLIITTEVLFSSIGMPISCIHVFEKWTGFDFVCPILICVGDISCDDHRLLHHVYYTYIKFSNAYSSVQ